MSKALDLQKTAKQLILEIHRDDIDWHNEDALSAWRKSVDRRLINVLMACVLQNTTGGDRMDRALQNLQNVESRLRSTLSALGIEMFAHHRDNVNTRQKEHGKNDTIGHA